MDSFTKWGSDAASKGEDKCVSSQAYGDFESQWLCGLGRPPRATSLEQACHVRPLTFWDLAALFDPSIESE